MTVPTLAANSCGPGISVAAWLFHFIKRRDPVGEVGHQAASAAKREVRVVASGRPANQAVIRSRLRAAAVATCCRLVLALIYLFDPAFTMG